MSSISLPAGAAVGALCQADEVRASNEAGADVKHNVVSGPIKEGGGIEAPLPAASTRLSGPAVPGAATEDHSSEEGNIDAVVVVAHCAGLLQPLACRFSRADGAAPALPNSDANCRALRVPPLTSKLGASAPALVSKPRRASWPAVDGPHLLLPVALRVEGPRDRLLDAEILRGNDGEWLPAT